METNNLEGTLVTQQFLEQVVSGVKPLLNPQGITLDTPGYLFKVGLNPHLTDITYPLYINVNGLSSVENSHLQFKGQLLLATEDQLIGLNSGSTRVNQIAYSNTNPLNLYFILGEHVTSFSVEVLSSAYKENLVSTIEVENPGDIEQYLDNEDATVLTIVEDSTFEGYVFKYVDKTGEGHFVPSWYTPAPGETITTIDSVKEAGTAERAEVAENLDHDVTVNIVSDPNSLVTMTGTGVIESDLTTSTLTINATSVNLPEQNIPLATTTKRGGMKLYGSEDPGYNNFPVQLSNEKAYVHVPLGDMDIHRYKDLLTVPNPKVGDIVQYIGNTTEEYVNGYFYQYWPTDFTTSINGERWMLTTSSTAASAAIREYNKSINYTLRPNVNIVISLLPYEDSESDSDEETEIPFTNDTLFRVTQQQFSVDITLSEFSSNFGISLKPAYSTSYTVGEEDLYTVVVSWNSAGSGGEWIQKNVQPLVEMASAISYKGTREWAELEALTPSAQQGDFYTISDRSNQEWFFNGILTDDWEDSWEYMGEIVATYTAGTNININSNREISAEGYVYDSVKKSIATGTLTQATGQDSHAEGKGFTNPTGTSYIKAEGIGSHAEGMTVNTQSNIIARGRGAHAEGYTYGEQMDILAEGYGAHAEGYQGVQALNHGAHAEGSRTTAYGLFSHTEGYETQASNYSEHAEGIANLSHQNSESNGDAGNTLSSIGFGWDGTRKNAIEVMQNGDVYIAGIGNYTGTTIKASGNNIRTLQDVIGSSQTYAAGLDIDITNNVISVDNTLNEQTISDESDYTIDVEYDNAKYNIINLTDHGERNTFYINVSTSGITHGPREVIYRITSEGAANNINIALASGDSGILEAYAPITQVDKDQSVEIIFTFWKNGLVTYNGGEKI